MRGATIIDGVGRAAEKLRIDRKTIANVARVVVKKCRIDNFSSSIFCESGIKISLVGILLAILARQNSPVRRI